MNLRPLMSLGLLPDGGEKSLPVSRPPQVAKGQVNTTSGQSRRTFLKAALAAPVALALPGQAAEPVGEAARDQNIPLALLEGNYADEGYIPKITHNLQDLIRQNHQRRAGLAMMKLENPEYAKYGEDAELIANLDSIDAFRDADLYLMMMNRSTEGGYANRAADIIQDLQKSIEHDKKRLLQSYEKYPVESEQENPGIVQVRMVIQESLDLVTIARDMLCDLYGIKLPNRPLQSKDPIKAIQSRQALLALVEKVNRRMKQEGRSRRIVFQVHGSIKDLKQWDVKTFDGNTDPGIFGIGQASLGEVARALSVFDEGFNKQVGALP